MTAMPLDIPPELKKIAPYIKRAEELDKDTTAPESRLVAYYLRQYAVQLGIPLATGSSPAAKTCLGTILGDLEKEKAKMDNFTRDEAAFLCRKFAMSVFDKADNEDRAGLGGKGTAKTFYAAQSFIQMLEQFNPSNSDSQTEEESDQAADDKKRILYCKWKATEILKAIKEGRQPTPGGYGDDIMDNLLQPDTETNEDKGGSPPDAAVSISHKPVVETVVPGDDDFGFPVVPPSLPPPLLPSPTAKATEKMDEEGTEVELGPPPAYSTTTNNSNIPDASRPTLSFNLPNIDVLPPPVPTPTKAKPTGIFGGFINNNNNTKKSESSSRSISKIQLNDAIELTKFALAALEDRDGDLAAERLQQALTTLGR